MLGQIMIFHFSSCSGPPDVSAVYSLWPQIYRFPLWSQNFQTEPEDPCTANTSKLSLFNHLDFLCVIP